MALADDIPQAEKLSEQFSALHSVARVESVGPLVPKDYEKKAPVLKEIVKLLQTIPIPIPEDAAQSGTGKGLVARAIQDGLVSLDDL